MEWLLHSGFRTHLGRNREKKEGRVDCYSNRHSISEYLPFSHANRQEEREIPIDRVNHNWK